MTSSSFFAFESSSLFLNGEPFHLKLSDFYLDFDPNFHNACRIYVDLSLESSLDFSLASKMASSIKEKGGRILWDFHIDFPSTLSHLKNEGIFNAYFDAFKLFSEGLYKEFQQVTIGCSLIKSTSEVSKLFSFTEGDFFEFTQWLEDEYKTIEHLFEVDSENNPLGELKTFSDLSPEMFEITPFSRHLKNLFAMNVFSAFLHRLVSALPEEILPFAEFDVEGISHLGFLSQLLSKERFSHIHLIFKDSFLPLEALYLNQNGKPQSKPNIGVCFPNDPNCLFSILNQFKGLFAELKKRGVSYKIIPEFLMTSSWDELDSVIYLKKSLSSQGKRILQGFFVAGGQLIYIDETSNFENEISFREFLK